VPKWSVDTVWFKNKENLQERKCDVIFFS